MSESPISLRDETGIERFRGTQSPGGGSQPFTPTDLDGLALWLDASDASTINAGSPANGDPVTAWRDKSASGFDASTGTGVVEYVAATKAVRFGADSNPAALDLSTAGDLFSGIPGVTFAVRMKGDPSGSEQVLTAYVNPLTDDIFVAELDVMSNASSPASNNAAALSFDDTGSLNVNGKWFCRDETVAVVAVSNKGAAISSEPFSTLPTVPESTGFQPPEYGEQTAGTEATSGVTPVVTATVSLGNLAAGPALIGDLRELIVVQRVLTAGERRQLFEYLSAKAAA